MLCYAKQKISYGYYGQKHYIFVKQKIIFHSEFTCSSGCTWIPPANWTGEQPVYYQDFETLNCMELHNARQIDNGKVIFNV